MENSEDFRTRIAKDLNNSIGYELLTLKRSLYNKIQINEDKVDAILREVRTISRNFFPTMVNEIGLKRSVEQLAQSVFEFDGLFVHTEINYKEGLLDAKAELTLFKILQEAISNSGRYANAQSAKISIHQIDKAIQIAISDNGKGFNFEQVMKTGNAFGLLGIIQRCKALRCTPIITSNDQGTFIQFSIPLTYA